ncbi:LysE family transporter [Ktedonobacter robiniae]|uniref:Chemotactic transduction protein ChpE n=1 Tax=Ktedonobacter robiniae TaxID=2778365 RepID=A0ABQ3ULE7_9CHLR|nr:LysE family transporter [Ktedonobacter robiniae]GHO53571.1 chemotactic transduction protein ChpE [Ktedonobacter robiniae]
MPLFFSAFGLGLALFATPGAITAQLLRGLGRRGFLGALSLQLGALLGLLLWAVVALIGAAFLVQNMVARMLLGATGVLLLLLLMWQALKDAYQGSVGEKKAANGQGDFILGIALTLANPFPVVFWLSVLPTLIATRQMSLDFKEVMVFFAGFLVSASLWSVLISSLISYGRRFVTPAFFRLVNLICGLALGFFALKLLWSMLTLLNG